MRNVLVCLMAITLSLGLFSSDVFAKRFGGGRSFGVQRSHHSLFSSPKSQKAVPKMQSSNRSKWGGILGGMLIGGLLTSLFMGHGFANGLMTWLILGSIIFFIVTMFRKKLNSGWQSATSNAFNSNSNNECVQTSSFTNSGHMPTSNYPAGFDEDGFLRTVKVTFIRLQAAYDQKNIQDISSFTSPEVYAEIKMQLDERGNNLNNTEVVDLKAELLDVSKQVQSYMASVHFTGSIKENNEPVSELDEIWHFYQFSNSSEWVVGGIQQAVKQL